MSPSIMLAQRSTLCEWAEDWDKLAAAEPNCGHSAVAFLLRRSAVMIARVANGNPDAFEEPIAPVEIPAMADDLRVG